MSRPSLKDIAEELGVSAQTVSRALRNKPYVKAELAEKIREVAERLGYQPDPRVSSLLRHVRSGGQRNGECIGLLLPDSLIEDAQDYFYLREILEGAKQRAKSGGFSLSVFSMLEHTPRQLERMLRSRGIHLLILAPPVHQIRMHVHLTWEEYATVLVGPAIWRPRLNRVLVNYHMNMLEIGRILRKMSYRKPALVCRSPILQRALYAVEASFRQVSLLMGFDNADNMIWREQVRGNPAFGAWLRRQKPDVVISDDDLVSSLEECGHHVPGDLGFVHLNLPPHHGRKSGMDVRLDLLGGNAVDVLAGHFLRNERGIPDNPKLILNQGIWCPGQTLRNPGPVH